MDGGSNQDNYFFDPALLDPDLLDPSELNSQLNPDQFNPNQVDPNQVDPNQFNPNQFNPNQFNPNQFNPNQFNPNQVDPNQLGPSQTDSRLVGHDLFDPGLFEPNLLDPNLLNPNIFQSQDYIAPITANQQHQYGIQTQTEATEQQQTQLQIDRGSLDHEQQQAVYNISERIGPEFYEMSAEAQYAAVENELAIIRSAANVQFPPFSAQDPGGELFGQQDNYQDIPLSEQQGPPDVGAQFLAETQPGEQPVWYDVDVVREDLANFKPSDTDNYPYYDDGPRRPKEQVRQAHQRIFRAQFAMGLEMRPVYPPIPNKEEGETHYDFAKRKKARVDAVRIQEGIHSRKMNPSHKDYDANYTREWTNYQIGRRQRNEKRRAAVLAWRRAYDDQLNLLPSTDPKRPRATTPEYNDNGREGKLYSEDFFFWEKNGIRRTIALEEKRQEELRGSYAQQPPPTGPRPIPPTISCQQCKYVASQYSANICDLSDLGYYPCSNCAKRGWYCYGDLDETTWEKREQNEDRKRRREKRVKRDKLAYERQIQQRWEYYDAQQEQAGAPVPVERTQFSERGRPGKPRTLPPPVPRRKEVASMSRSQITSSQRRTPEPQVARRRSASPQRRVCNRCARSRFPGQCDGDLPCSVCVIVKNAELCRYDVDIAGNPFGDVAGPADDDDLYSASPPRSPEIRRAAERSLFNSALQDALSGPTSVAGSFSPQGAPSGINPLGVLPHPPRSQDNFWQSLDHSALTEVAAGTDAQHGFGGIPEPNRAQQELENASAAWNPGAPEPESYVPQFDASNYNTYEDLQVARQSNEEPVGYLPGLNPRAIVQQPVTNNSRLTDKMSLRWDGSDAVEGPQPGGNIFHKVPSRRFYYVDFATGIEQGFHDDVAGTCTEQVPLSADPATQTSICMTKPAKACDRLGHRPLRHTCRDCHGNQNYFVSDVEALLIENTKAFLCKVCTEKAQQSNAVLAWCACSDQLKTSWLCHNDRKALLKSMEKQFYAMQDYMERVGGGRNFCVGCFVNDADPGSNAWGCFVCREWVYFDPRMMRVKAHVAKKQGRTRWSHIDANPPFTPDQPPYIMQLREIAAGGGKSGTL